jgi:hypothetical protein
MLPIRDAIPEDASLIRALIQELAEYDGESDHIEQRTLTSLVTASERQRHHCLLSWRWMISHDPSLLRGPRRFPKARCRRTIAWPRCPNRMREIQFLSHRRGTIHAIRLNLQTNRRLQTCVCNHDTQNNIWNLFHSGQSYLLACCHSSMRGGDANFNGTEISHERRF